MKRFGVGRWLVAGIVGSIVFWLFQISTGPATITRFMGEQIVAQGGYPENLTWLIGWGVHLAVSLGYAFLFAAIMAVFHVPSVAGRLVLGLVIGAALGWITTLLTVPAITATISVLSGKGFPDSLPPLNTAYGLPFWNHMLFFGILWLVYLLIPALGRKD